MAFDVTAVLKANVSNFTSGIKEAQSVFESFQSKSNRTFRMSQTDSKLRV